MTVTPLPTIVNYGTQHANMRTVERTTHLLGHAVWSAAGHPHCVFQATPQQLEPLCGGTVSEAIAADSEEESDDSDERGSPNPWTSQTPAMIFQFQ